MPPLPECLQEPGSTDRWDLDARAMNATVMPVVKRTPAATRQQSPATMEMMGINRIVVDGGEI